MEGAALEHTQCPGHGNKVALSGSLANERGPLHDLPDLASRLVHHPRTDRLQSRAPADRGGVAATGQPRPVRARPRQPCLGQFWVDGRHWHGDWFPVPGASHFDHQHQHVVGVSRAPANLDLFVIGLDNRVWTQLWVDGRDWHQEWIPLSGAARFGHQRSASPRSRVPRRTSACPCSAPTIGLGASSGSTAVGWIPEWFAVPGGTLVDHRRQQVAAVSRASDDIDLFAIGGFDWACSQFWAPRVQVSLDARLEQNGRALPMTVTLHIDGTRGSTTEPAWTLTKDAVPVPGAGERVPHGEAMQRIFGLSDVGEYDLSVTRTGLTAPGAPATLRRVLHVSGRVADRRTHRRSNLPGSP